MLQEKVTNTDENCHGEEQQGAVENKDKGDEKDQVVTILNEWKNFSVTVFFIGLVISVFPSVLDLVTDFQLGVDHWNNGNLVIGMLTIAIPFLPGIQWYTTITTEYKLTRFLSSLFFPVFLVAFKVSMVNTLYLKTHGIYFLDWPPISARTKNCRTEHPIGKL